MTWTRLSDGFTGRPEVMGLSADAFRSHIEALVWCNEQLTDGHVPAPFLRRILSTTDPDDVATDLAKAGLWEATETGWLVEWGDQETAERVTERREFNRARVAKYRERGEKHKAGDHSQCTSSCPSRNALRNAERTATRPVPSRPVGKGKGQGADARSPEGSRAGAQKEKAHLCPHGVMNGIWAGQCTEPICEEAYYDLKSCSQGGCTADDPEMVMCTGWDGRCFLRDDWLNEQWFANKYDLEKPDTRCPHNIHPNECTEPACVAYLKWLNGDEPEGM